MPRKHSITLIGHRWEKSERPHRLWRNNGRLLIYSTLSSYPFCGETDAHEFSVRISCGSNSLHIISKPLPTAPVLFRTSPDQWNGWRRAEGPREKFRLREKWYVTARRGASWKTLFQLLQVGGGGIRRLNGYVGLAGSALNEVFRERMMNA